jgi:hypothetical protein
MKQSIKQWLFYPEKCDNSKLFGEVRDMIIKNLSYGRRESIREIFNELGINKLSDAIDNPELLKAIKNRI